MNSSPLPPPSTGPSPTAAGSRPSSGTALQREAIGTWDLVFFVVAAAAPLTVMGGIAPIGIAVAGPGAVAGYLVAGIALTLFAVGFTAMSRHVSNAGAFYAYIAQGLGRPVGVGAALVALFSYTGIGVGLYGAFGFFAHTTGDDLLHLDLPWWIWALASAALVWLLGFRQVTLSAKVLGFALAAEVLVLAVLAVAVLAQGGPEGFGIEPFRPDNIFTDGFAGALAVTFGAFIGFEATAIYGEEARDAGRSVSRATYIAVGFLAVFYTFIAWIVVTAYGPSLVTGIAQENPPALVFAATDKFVGSAAVDAMNVLIVTSSFAAILAFHNASNRYFFALGRERVLPRPLARVHAVHRSPWVAGAVSTVLSVVVIAGFALAGLDPFLKLLIWLNSPGIIGIMALQALCSFAVVGFYLRRPELPGSRWVRLIAPLLGGIVLTAATWLAVDYMDLVTAAGASTNLVLLLPLPIVFTAGVLLALRLRATDPARYERLTTTDVEESTV
ncbi:APC family permease [Streptomyces sp. NPDC051020]|uniref:APC family permease n=1 Tax=Streptomyces sp. NPDC051020 TaxID=3155409 RepID=UPI00343C73F7